MYKSKYKARKIFSLRLPHDRLYFQQSVVQSRRYVARLFCSGRAYESVIGVPKNQNQTSAMRRGRSAEGAGEV